MIVIERIPDKVYRILIAGQMSTLTFDVLPYDLLLAEVIPRFVQASPYYQDPTLMYHLGKFTITHITHHPFVISGIISYPDLSLEHKGIAFSITTVPIHYNNKIGILDIPAMIVQGADDNIWIPNHSTCDFTPHVIVCPINMIHEDMDVCASALFSNSSMQVCRTYSVHSYTPMIRHTTGGLLVGASNETITMMKHTQDNVPVVKDEHLHAKSSCQHSEFRRSSMFCLGYNISSISNILVQP